jgi:hypothetical protein
MHVTGVAICNITGYSRALIFGDRVTMKDFIETGAPLFRKIMALVESSGPKGERDTAKRKAEACARKYGVAFDDAIAYLSYIAGQERVFASFGGLKADMRLGRSIEWFEKRAAWKTRLAALMAKYGSEKAALAPCERERLIVSAVAKVKGNPDRIKAAIISAYPMPKTFREAFDEFMFWKARGQDLDDINDVEFTERGQSLDEHVEERVELIRELVFHKLSATCVADIRDRFRLIKDEERQFYNGEAEALARDLDAVTNAPAGPSAAPKTALVIEAIKANPKVSDREIARLVGCSAMTVGRTRAKIGAKLDVRNFTRGGKVYTMRERRRNGKPLDNSDGISATS